MINRRVDEVDVAPCSGGGDGVGSGFDAIAGDIGLSAMQFGLAFDDDCLEASVLDFGAHEIEHIGERDDFGFTGSVFEDGLPLSEACGHEHHVRCADGGERKSEMVACEGL